MKTSLSNSTVAFLSVVTRWYSMNRMYQTVDQSLADNDHAERVMSASRTIPVQYCGRRTPLALRVSSWGRSGDSLILPLELWEYESRSLSKCVDNRRLANANPEILQLIGVLELGIFRNTCFVLTSSCSRSPMGKTRRRCCGIKRTLRSSRLYLQQAYGMWRQFFFCQRSVFIVLGTKETVLKD